MTSRRFIRSTREESDCSLNGVDDAEEVLVEEEIDTRPFYKKPLNIVLMVIAGLAVSLGIAYLVTRLVKRDQERKQAVLDNLRNITDDERKRNQELEDKLVDRDDCVSEGMTQISQEEYDSLVELREQVAEHLKRNDKNDDYEREPRNTNDDEIIDISRQERVLPGNGVNDETYFRTQLVYSRPLNQLKLCKIESKVTGGRLIDIDRDCVSLDSITQGNANNAPSAVMTDFVRGELMKAIGRNRRMDTRIAEQLGRVI